MSTGMNRSDEATGSNANTQTDQICQSLQQVDDLLRQAGVNSEGIKHSDTHGQTMKALLHQYTQHATLTERDRNGENPNNPSCRQDRGETRALRTRDRTTDADRGGFDTEQQRGGQKAALVNLLRHLDNDRFPQLKDQMTEKGNALPCEEFIALLRTHIGYIEGCDEKQLTSLIGELHEYLATDGEGATACEAAPAENCEATAFLTEPAAATVVAPLGTDNCEDKAALVVSWNDMARFLLDCGIVSDVVQSVDVMKVLNHIDKDKIEPLQQEFLMLGDALSIEQFIVTMKRQFQHIFNLTSLFELHHEERRLHAQLLSLYEMIDIGAKGAMSWAEFTAFLVDQGMTEDVAREFNIIRFRPSKAKYTLTHNSHIVRCFYLKQFDKVAFFEADSKALRLVTSDLMPYAELKEFSNAELKEFSKEFSTVPLCCEYIHKYKLFVVCCSDLTLSVFDADKLKLPVLRFKTKTAQLVMCWSEVGQCLFSADHNGMIRAWELSSIKVGPGARPGPESSDKSSDEVNYKDYLKKSLSKQDPPMRHIIEWEGGEGIAPSITRPARGNKKAGPDPRHASFGDFLVMQLLELPVLGQLASCGADGIIMIWDVITGQFRNKLTGHVMGVTCMAFAPSTKVLVTGGYDYKIFAWNPYVGNWIHTIHGPHGHSAPIVGIEVLGAASNQIVSADEDGFLKTWDLGTYQCLETIFLGENFCLRAFVSIPSHKRVLACDRRLVAYDYQNTGVADQTDEEPIIKAFYNPRLKVFISACSTHLRLWDAVTGAIRCVIWHKEAEITDFCVDDRGLKVFIADHEGHIYVHNTTTGCFIKKLTPHRKEVSGLIYCRGDQNLITVSWDRSIMVHDESEKAPKCWRKATNIHGGDVTCVAFSRHLGLIATGSTDNVISLREYERLRTVSSLVGHKSDVTALAFVEPFALLASADSSGFVAVWSVPAPSGRQHRYVNEVLTRFINMQSLESSASVNCLDPVYEADDGSHHGRFHLFAGDEDGDVRAWDLTQLLVAADVSPCTPKADWDPRKSDLIDCTHNTVAVARQAADAPELQIRCEQQVVRQLLSWRAHGDSVRSLKVHAEPRCIVTAGYDHMVKIWTREGELMTVLRAYGAIPWVFPVSGDTIGVDDETLEEVLQKVRTLETSQLPAKRGLLALPSGWR